MNTFATENRTDSNYRVSIVMSGILLHIIDCWIRIISAIYIIVIAVKALGLCDWYICESSEVR